MKNESQLTTAEQSFSFWYSENGEEELKTPWMLFYESNLQELLREDEC